MVQPRQAELKELIVAESEPEVEVELVAEVVAQLVVEFEAEAEVVAEMLLPGLGRIRARESTLTRQTL